MTQEREAFEAWVLQDLLDAPVHTSATDKQWRAWQARASLAQPASMFNGLTEAETDATASVFGLVGAQPASVPALDKQAAFEAWLENYPIQVVGDDYELCSDAFDAGVLAAAPAAPQPEAQPQWQLPAQRLVQWLHCMSYNDSYFGEPAGYLKQCVNELKHLLPPNEVRAAPSAQAPQPEAQPTTSPAGEDYKQPPGSKNCMQVAVSYMLGLPMSAVPDFEKAGPDAWESFYAFFAERGFTAEMFPPSVEIEGDYLASGSTERGTSHMVVMRGGKLLHDPHQSNTGLMSIEAVWLIVRRAAAPSAQADPTLAELREKLGGWDVPEVSGKQAEQGGK